MITLVIKKSLSYIGHDKKLSMLSIRSLKLDSTAGEFLGE